MVVARLPRTRQILRDRSGMNGTERAWSQELEKLRLAGQLLWWRFEPFKLQLGPGAFFTPDFALLWADGELAFDEVKGHWREAARVRIKVAAGLYPFFRFRVVVRGRKGEPAWKIEEI